MYVEEFLYRGKVNDTDAAWHVVLAATVDDGLGGTVTTHRGPLSIGQAEVAGFALPTILAEINSQVLKQHDALVVDKQALTDALTLDESDKVALLNEKQVLLAEIDRLTAKLAAASTVVKEDAVVAEEPAPGLVEQFINWVKN